MAVAPMRAPWLARTEAMVPVSCVAMASRNAKSAASTRADSLSFSAFWSSSAREYALTDVEFFGDLGLRVARIGGVHEPERGHLHQREQCHEEHDDAGLQALDAHQDTRRSAKP